jgi:hypothetical protein
VAPKLYCKDRTRPSVAIRPIGFPKPAAGHWPLGVKTAHWGAAVRQESFESRGCSGISELAVKLPALSLGFFASDALMYKALIRFN